MCTVLLPPGVNPTAVNKYININIDIDFRIQITAVAFSFQPSALSSCEMPLRFLTTAMRSAIPNAV
jgi:hypothetical protein